MDAGGLEAQEKIPASRKLGRDVAEGLIAEATRLVVAKGKKVTEFKGADLQSEDAVNAMLGPTGNLRAPTLKVGKTLIVGYNEDVYETIFG
ncbi:MAG: ArsC family (seleno)protein [Myxococcota bacterium]